MSLYRIGVLFKKDIRENYSVILIFLLLSAMLSLMPLLNTPADAIAVYPGSASHEFSDQAPFSVVGIDSIDEGEQLLEERRVAAIVDTVQKTATTQGADLRLLGELKSALSNNDADSGLITVETIGEDNVLYNATLCVFLFLLLCLVGCPIVYMADTVDGVLSYLFVTPLSYVEFIAAKTLFCFVSLFLSLSVFLLGFCGYRIDPGAFLVFVVLVSCFGSSISGIATVLFRSIESYLLVGTPLVVLLSLGLFSAMGQGLAGKTLVIPMFFDVIARDHISLFSIALLIVSTTLLMVLYVNVFRRFRRRGA